METISDLKTLRIDKNVNFKLDTRRPFRKGVDTKVMGVRRLYMLQAEKLDIKCGGSYTTRPFSDALNNHFNSGGVHSPVFGTFGETNETIVRILKMCAQYAVIRSKYADVMPLSKAFQK